MEVFFAIYNKYLKHVNHDNFSLNFSYHRYHVEHWLKIHYYYTKTYVEVCLDPFNPYK